MVRRRSSLQRPLVIRYLQGTGIPFDVEPGTITGISAPHPYQVGLTAAVHYEKIRALTNDLVVKTPADRIAFLVNAAGHRSLDQSVVYCSLHTMRELLRVYNDKLTEGRGE